MAYRAPNVSTKPAPQLLTQPETVGKLGTGTRARYRHVQGPNAIAKSKPISADLPLRPNLAPK